MTTKSGTVLEGSQRTHMELGTDVQGGEGKHSLADPRLGNCWPRADSGRMFEKTVAPPVSSTANAPPLSHFLFRSPTHRTKISWCVAFRLVHRHPRCTLQLHQLLLLPVPPPIPRRDTSSRRPPLGDRGSGTQGQSYLSTHKSHVAQEARPGLPHIQEEAFFGTTLCACPEALNYFASDRGVFKGAGST